MDEYGVQIMKYMLQIVAQDTHDLSIQHVNPMQMTFGNLPFIIETDMYNKYMWGSHKGIPNGQRPDGVFIIELVDSKTAESERLLMLYECDGNAAAKKDTFRKVAMKIRQGVDGSTKISETMPAVSVRANFDMRQSLDDPFTSNDNDDSPAAVVNSRQDNIETFDFLYELCVAHLWTAYNAVLLLYKQGTMHQFCHNTDKDHLYDLNFFIGRFAIHSSMSSTHVATGNLHKTVKCDDKNKRIEPTEFLNSTGGFFANWSVLSNKYTVRVRDAADIKCIAIQRVNFVKFMNDIKSRKISKSAAVKKPVRKTRASAKASAGMASDTSSSNSDSESSESSDDSNSTKSPAKTGRVPAPAKSIKSLSNEGMWTLLDIWNLILLCNDSGGNMGFESFSDTDLEIPNDTTVKKRKSSESNTEFFTKDNIFNTTIVQPLMDEFENVMYDIVSSIVWREVQGDKSMKVKLDNLKIGILKKISVVSTRLQCQSTEQLRMIHDIGHTSTSKSLTSRCQVSLHSTLPLIDTQMQAYVKRLRTPNVELFLRMIRCVNLFALKELALRYETESIGSEFQRVLHTLPVGTQSEILYLFDTIKKDDSAFFSTVAPTVPSSSTHTQNKMTIDLRNIAYQIYREYESDKYIKSFRHLLLDTVDDIMQTDLKLAPSQAMWVQDLSVNVPKSQFGRTQQEYREPHIPFAWKVLICEELIKTKLEKECGVTFEEDTNEIIKKKLKDLLRIMMVNVRYIDRDNIKCGCYISSKAQWVKKDIIQSHMTDGKDTIEWDLEVECDGGEWYMASTESWEYKRIKKYELSNTLPWINHEKKSLDLVDNLTGEQYRSLKIYIKSTQLEEVSLNKWHEPVMACYYIMINNEMWIPVRKFEVLGGIHNEEGMNTIEFKGYNYVKIQNKSCKILDTWPIRDVNHCMKHLPSKHINATDTDNSNTIDLKLNSNQFDDVVYYDIEQDELYAWAWMWNDMQTHHTAHSNQGIPIQLQMKEYWKRDNVNRPSSKLELFLNGKIDTEKYNPRLVNDTYIWLWKRLLIKQIFMHTINSICTNDTNGYIDVLCMDRKPKMYMSIHALNNVRIGLSDSYLKNCDDYITPRNDTPNLTLLTRVDILKVTYTLPALVFSKYSKTYVVSFNGKDIDMTNHTFSTKKENSQEKIGVTSESSDMYDITCRQVSLKYMENNQYVTTTPPYKLRAVLIKNIPGNDLYTKWEAHLY